MEPESCRNKPGATCVIVAGCLVLLIGLHGTLASPRTIASQLSVKAAEPPKADKPPASPPERPEKNEDPKHILSKFMRQKLQASSQILEGLCTEDLEMVSEGSAVLLQMSNEERWRVSNDIMYRRYSQEFATAVEELQKESKDQDMDGTSLAWVNVTMKCLKCHEWVRNTVLAQPKRQP
ncbi:MAG: hypothetical protein WCK86_03195 [Planctomycetia bacterium]